MKSLVAVDISGDFIRAVEVASFLTAKPVLLRYGEIGIPKGIAGESEIHDSEVIARLLTQLWEETQFKSKSVVLGISGRKLQVREYETAFVSMKQVRATLEFGAADILPTQVEGSILDFYPIEIKKDGKDVDHVRGLVIAAPAEPIEHIIKAFTIAKLSVDYVDYGAFAAARAFRKARGTETGNRLLVNIRTHTTEIIALRDSVPMMVRVLPYGLSVRSKAGAKHRAPLNSLQAFGAPGSRAEGTSVDTVDNLLGGLRSTADFFEGSGFKSESIVLMGEGARSEELLMKLLPALKMKPEVLKLSEVLEPTKQELRDDLIEASLPSIVGLAMRGVK